MSKIISNVSQLVGNTPILKLKGPEESANVFVKLEFFNPGGSVKDRIALGMIEDAEEKGLLKPGATIIEPTSGNTGIGLAMIGATKGYHVILVMPDTMTVERQKLMKAYGAEVMLTPGAEGMTGSIKLAEELAEKNGYYLTRQFDNPANPATHEKTTAKEIIDAFEGEKIDAFIAGVGTGGTLTGVGHELRKVYPDIKIYAVEPNETEILRGGVHAPHRVQGIGAGFVPTILDTEVYDGVIGVPSQDALDTARYMGKSDGILVGGSAGAVIFAARQLAEELGPNKNVVTLAPDNGERYLSTNLYSFDN
ncbi:cysteine synthase A [Vagococcus sp. DIV0080]|uniref:Cysteine synthase n=1 Tax=Candidatus Vagococcus giribetii TaxID=2230876 RepID=A0ABS3HR60_9ENTE|nr:cysteine synthase A [Vagococcus sp. DIV0080]MBO0476249.1 cysteine synthase A [Vagococcus sp. DIV0080]